MGIVQSMRASANTTPGLTRLAVSATLHCLTGCAIGEVLGMVIGTALGWSNLATIALAVVLAFFFGYALTVRPVFAFGPATACGYRCGPSSRYRIDRGDGDRR